MKEMKKPVPENRDDGDGDRGHIVHFRLSDSDYRTLAGLARYHGTSIARLLTGALPLVIEKYRVLRALRVPPDARVSWRRNGGA